MQQSTQSSTQQSTSTLVPASANAARRLLLVGTLLTVGVGVGLSLLGYTQPVVMGTVQGLGEFLPISSSAHLILTPWFLNWQGGAIDTLTFDVALHLGTLIAVLAYFWRDWLGLFRALPAWFSGLLRRGEAQPTHETRLITLIAIATIPGGLAGVLFDKWAETSLRAPLLLAITLPVLGVFLYLADARRPQRTSIDQMTWRTSLLIGLAQAFAIIPGVSRSGVTMTMGRTLTLDRTTAARFSFLLSAPITAAAVLFKLPAMLAIPAAEVPTFVIGVAMSGAVGALAISGLLSYIRRAGFAVFAAYRVALAVVIVLVLVLRGGLG